MAVSPPLTGPPGAPPRNTSLTAPLQDTPIQNLAPQLSGSEDLNLLYAWREPFTPKRLMPAAVGSVLFHVVVLIAVILLPEQEFTSRPATIIHPELRRTILEMPRDFEPTQKDPNQGKISHELDVRSMQSAPEPQAPRFHPPTPPPGPVAQAVTPQVQLPAIETPKLEPPKIDVPAATPAEIAVAPKATPPPAEKPKLAFEDVGPGPARSTSNPDRSIPTPKELVPDLLHNKSTSSGGGGTIVGDLGDYSLANPNSVHAPSPGDIKSSMQLLSDPKGIDFKPYMIQVLMAVRRNWLAILPESARSGRRGRVIVQFAIDRTGGVPKLVIAEGAGADALDRAAVAAISASVPLPPLPAEFKGDQIRLQFAFSYNMPAH
jgi:TonB family protein